MEERYGIIVSMVLNYFCVNNISILNDKNNKEELYILLLTLDSYGVFHNKEFLKSRDISMIKNIKGNLIKAEEKLLINRDFRRKYYDMRKKIEKII